jgi:hypothetical protein
MAAISGFVKLPNDKRPTPAHFRRIDRTLPDDKLRGLTLECEVPVLTRRKFTLISSLAALLGAVGCGGSDDTLAGCDGVGAVSDVVEGHSHTVCVPASNLAGMPTVPILYTTSTAEGHTHQITLSPEQNSTLASGGTVADVVSTMDSGHSHTFTLSG